MTTILPKLVFDDTLAIESQINYAVEKSGMAINHKKQRANTATSTSLKFDLNIPSPTTVVDPEMLVEVKYIATYTGVPAAGKYLVNFGDKGDCIAPFPLHQHASVIRANINGSAVTANVNTYLDAYLRCLPRDKLAKYSSMTPTQLDEYANYADLAVAPWYVPNSPFTDYGNTWGDHIPRGAFKIDSIVDNTVGDGTAVKNVVVSFTTVEPILMSPFHQPGSKSAGLYGVGNIDIEYVLEGLSNTRFARWIAGAHGPGAKAISNITLGQDAYCHYRVITPNPADRIPPSVSVVPLQQINPHSTQESGQLAIGATATTTTNTLTLSACPDKIMIFVRDRKSNLRSTSADAYATINRLKIGFGGQDNLLAGASQQQLYVMSKEAGLEQLNWQQFSGKARKNQGKWAISAAGIPELVTEDANRGDYALTGSVVILQCGRDLAIPESYYAPGSQGSFALSVEVEYTNHLGYDITPEVIVCDIHSGVLVTSNRVSTPFFGVLSKEMVLNALTQEPIFHSNLERAIGGSFWSKAKAFATRHLPAALGLAKNALGQVNTGNANVNKAASMGQKALGALGYGEGEEGGYLTGGANKRIAKHLK